MKKTCAALSFFLICFVSSFEIGNSQNQPPSKPEIIELWASERTFETPESVLHDDRNDVIYVSNISGSPRGKDGNGFISKISSDGTIETLKWIDGLNAPKGMGLFNQRLFVADLDRIVEISTKQEKVLKEYQSAHARFLNDVSIDDSGHVFVSDNMANLIFHLKDGKLEPWLSSPELKGPNGLLAERDRLLVGNNGFVLAVDYQTKKITRIIENTDSIDGLCSYGNGHYLVSNFLGAVYLIHPEKDKVKILDTSPEEIMAADIDFIESSRILLIPTFFDNRVVAYQFKEKE